MATTIKPTRRGMAVRIAFSVIGIVVGLVVSVVFGVEFHNYHASIWGLVSGLVASFVLYVHLTFKKGRYETDPAPLRVFLYCGCFTQLAGLCGLVGYLVLAIVEKQGVVVYGPGYYVAAVWCLMTFKWGFLLFYFSRSYWRATVLATAILFQPEEAQQADIQYYGSKS